MSETTSSPAPVSAPVDADAPSKRRPNLIGLGVIAVALLAVLVNALAGSALRSVRIDLTQEKLYSLSPSVAPFLQGLDEPVNVQLFVSRGSLSNLPVYRAHATRVQEFLEEMQRVSDGKLKLTVLDPEPFSDAEDQAQAAGLEQVRTGQVGQTLVLGVVLTNAVDDRKVLPFLDPAQEPTLEYDLVRAISTLAQVRKPRVGLITSLPMAGSDKDKDNPSKQGGRPYVAYQQLEQVYDLQTVERFALELPKDLDALVIVHPMDLTDQLLREIDAYAHGGGRLLVFFDPQHESAPQEKGKKLRRTPRSYLGRMLKAWGVQVAENMVVTDPTYGQRVQTQSRGGLKVVPMISWLGLTQEAMADQTAMTRSLQMVLLASAGSITRTDDAPASQVFTPLMQTSTEAALVDTLVTGRYAVPEEMLRSHVPDGKRYVMAARLTGPVALAYPEPPADPDADLASDPAGQATDTSADASETVDAAPVDDSVEAPLLGEDADIVLIADADVLVDRFWIQDNGFSGPQATAENGTFLISAVEALAGNPVLSKLRPRAPSRRPFTRIIELQRAAEAQYLAEEHRLQEEVRSTEQRLNQLLQQAPPDAQTLTLNSDQQAEIQKMQGQVLASRKALRAVQYELRRSIDRLGQLLMLLNVAAWPALVALFVAMGLALRWRRSRVRS